MKRLHLHSISDVITNSSSEMFVCDTNKTIERVRKDLESMLKCFNETNDMDYSFDDVFEVPRRATKEDQDSAITYDTYRKEQLESLKKDGLSMIAIALGNDKEGKIPTVGKTVIIQSESDNTIPYELFEQIERTFKASRYHLG